MHFYTTTEVSDDSDSGDPAGATDEQDLKLARVGPSYIPGTQFGATRTPFMFSCSRAFANVPVFFASLTISAILA